MTAETCRVVDVDQGTLADGLLTVGRSDGTGNRFVVAIASIVATNYQQPRDVLVGNIRSRTSQILTLLLASGQTVTIIADGDESVGFDRGEGPLLWSLWEQLWVDLRDRSSTRALSPTS